MHSRHSLHHGDALAVLATIADASIDACVTDPPYGLAFMGKHWDRNANGENIAFSVDLWREVLRVLKPGGHVLAFGGTRTSHRMVCAIEDAGFEVRDSIAWIYASGFPKSLDVSKAIDKDLRGMMVRAKLLHFASSRGVDGQWLEMNGVASASSFKDWTIGGHVPGDKNWEIVKVALNVTAEEEAAFERDVKGRSDNGIAGGTGRHAGQDSSYGYGGTFDITTSATDAARQWEGWGTALKPAIEPVCMARKPLVGTVAANVQAHGTGALNIDGCRIGSGGQGKWSTPRDMGYNGGTDSKESTLEPNDKGRWPANAVFDERTAVELDRQSGVSTTGIGGGAGIGFQGGKGESSAVRGFGDTGGASRFFFVAKPDSAEREAGVSGLVARQVNDGRLTPIDNPCQRGETKRFNTHPTIKPVELMRYLVRLVTPTNGLVLDPFAGSGTTGVAALAENMRCVLIEREAEYIPIIEARMRRASCADGLFAEEGGA